MQLSSKAQDEDMKKSLAYKTNSVTQLSCCICETDSYKTHYKWVNGYDLVRCSECGLVYLDQYESEGDFIESSKKDEKRFDKQKIEYWSFPNLYRKYQDVFDGFFQERLERIYRYSPHAHTLFDIGCGYGFFMNFCSRKGLEVEGIDLSQEAVEYVRSQFHLNATLSTLEDFTFTKSYDVMILCDVLEHLANPGDQLKRIHEHMDRHGLLFIQVPNVIGLKIPRNHGYGLPFHLWQFNVKTLTLLLKKNGFSTINYWAGIQGVIGSYEQGGPRFKEKCEWYLARKLKIGNRLMAIAQPG